PPERPLDLALAFGVPGLAGHDLDTVVAGELQRRGVQAEALPLGAAQTAHAVGAGQLGHAAQGLEVPDQALEGVLAVDRGGEPPVEVAAPARHRPEAPQLVAQAPVPGPLAAVRPV